MGKKIKSQIITTTSTKNKKQLKKHSFVILPTSTPQSNLKSPIPHLSLFLSHSLALPLILVTGDKHSNTKNGI